MKAQINCFGKEMDVHLDELQPEGLRSLSGLKSSDGIKGACPEAICTPRPVTELLIP